jgi:lycopene beta-cyclase
VLAYARRLGARVARIAREETGILPLPARGMGEVGSASPLSAGYAGGFFHPVTGYSFPVALRVALHLAAHLGEDPFGADWRALVAAHRRQFRFAALLNRLLFGSFRPEDRWNVLERFYRLPEPTVRRFYALSTTTTDRLRIFCGRPPRGFSLRLPSPARAGALT